MRRILREVILPVLLRASSVTPCRRISLRIRHSILGPLTSCSGVYRRTTERFRRGNALRSLVGIPTVTVQHCPGQKTRLSPIWTKVDGSQRSCFSCHGFPPAGDHPASILCETCHGDVAGPGGTIKTPARHIDGVLDFGTATSRVQGGKGFIRYALHWRQSETDERSSLW